MDKLLSYTLLRLLQLVVWVLDTVLGLVLGRTITGARGGDTAMIHITHPTTPRGRRHQAVHTRFKPRPPPAG